MVAAGTALPEPLVVRVRDQAGEDLAGVQVTFRLRVGEVVVWESSAATDSTGRASVTVPLDGEPGTYSIVASVAGLDPVTFAAVGLAVPRTLTKLSGDDQQGAAGTALPEPLVVRVRDQAGGDLAGVQVTFGLRVGEVAVWESSATTDSTGRAAASMTLPRDPGTYTVEATAAGLDPVTFTVVAEVTPDFDADGQVGFSDFFLLAEALGGSDPRFDLDGDGTVGYGDFFLFAEHFTPPARGKLLALARERIGLPDEPGLAGERAESLQQPDGPLLVAAATGSGAGGGLRPERSAGGDAAGGPAEGRPPSPALGRPGRPGPAPWPAASTCAGWRRRTGCRPAS